MAEWIFPNNLKNYNSDEAMLQDGFIDWIKNRSMKSVAVGDTVYLYVTSPYSFLLWKCEVTATDVKLPPLGEDDPYVDEEYIHLVGTERLLRYLPLLDFKHMKQHGLKAMLMGPLRMNGELTDYIHSVIGTSDIDALRISDAHNIPQEDLQAMAKKYSTDTPASTVTQVTQIYRNPYIAEYAKQRANGVCQLCKQPAPFNDKDGRPYLESHHIQWLSQGGADSVDNTVALCPNCHKRMHIVNDPRDVETLKKL